CVSLLNSQCAVTPLRRLTPTPFPYTTLFRSNRTRRHPPRARGHQLRVPAAGALQRNHRPPADRNCRRRDARIQAALRDTRQRRRSEEHTSELQSRFDLVCRLLLAKKNDIEVT